MSATATPTPEQEQRARWDLLLLDIEHRSEQVRHMRSYNPIEIEARIEQVRQMKAYEGWRLAIQAIGASATVFIAGAAVGALLLNAFSGRL